MVSRDDLDLPQGF
jgi:hypothetical protein